LKINKNKILLWIGVAASIVMLGYFKYTNFFIAEFASIFGQDTVVLNIILPLGISFYTFSGIAYIIDVYRGEYEARSNPLDIALYIAFFAKITAGPIVRGKEFFPQLKNYRGIDASAFAEGIQIFVFGLFKKIVLADHLGVFVDDVFFAPSAFNTGTVILAAISYSLQIYFDFSGYSDMAIGIAKICGFDFKPNFNLPYIAKGMSDFWKRWHISLSSWFQDYLYIPLGGSRKGNVRTYINLILVMAVSGLWHGAGLTFIVWGVLHGIGSCITRLITKSGKATGKTVDIIRTVITYIVVMLLWVVFRASSFQNAWAIWKGMFTAHTGISQPYTWTFFALACLIVSTICAVHKSKELKEKSINAYYPVMDLTKLISLTIFFTFCGLTILLGYFGNTAFIYGKF
jgi:alginate O-acetyltransferase complex protein AlgI